MDIVMDFIKTTVERDHTNGKLRSNIVYDANHSELVTNSLQKRIDTQVDLLASAGGSVVITQNSPNAPSVPNTPSVPNNLNTPMSVADEIALLTIRCGSLAVLCRRMAKNKECSAFVPQVINLYSLYSVMYLTMLNTEYNVNYVDG